MGVFILLHLNAFDEERRFVFLNAKINENDESEI
jgi:hypothetical protein